MGRVERIHSRRSRRCLHGELLHEPAAGIHLARSLHRHPQPKQRHRAATDPSPHELRTPGIHARVGSRADAQDRDPGTPPCVVRRGVLGLGIPRGRHAQCRRAGVRLRARGSHARPGTRMSERLASAVYEGVVTHHRHAPREHAFSYRMAQLYLDLDEVDRVFADRWLWSAKGRNFAEFRRSDYLGAPELPLAEAVRERAKASLGYRPGGPVRVLTHLRYAGVVFNPVTFYYCYEVDGITLDCVVAEITNTPWR